MAGHGWRMLIECLSTGRAISLPTISNSIAKHTLAATGAYTRIRRQFGLPIAEFEGVQKPLARMAGFAYIINAATMQTAHAITQGAKPAVAASILKYHCTEMARQIINDGMDIQAGKAVMKGPKNMLSAAYESIPVGITVEGANIMTRSLMIFGQGAIRCHPYVLKEMALAKRTDQGGAVAEFDQLLFAHIGNTYCNAAHAFVGALTGSAFSGGDRLPAALRRYYRHISRLSAGFALAADMAMLTMQAALKKREMISGRLGDLLSTLYLASMVLKQYEEQGAPADLKPVAEWSCQYLFHQFQKAMLELANNLPNRVAGWKLKLAVMPLGGHYHMPADRLERDIAELVTHHTAVRTRLIEGIYLAPNDNNPIGKASAVLALADECEPLIVKMRKAQKSGQLPDIMGMELIDAAARAGVVNEDEAGRLRDFDRKIMDIINVDDFAYTAFARPDG
jgi:acyl-CoA dehydrogenase